MASSADAGARRIVAGASSLCISGDRGRLLKPCLRCLNGGPLSSTVGCSRESVGRGWLAAVAMPWLLRECRRLKFAEGTANFLDGESVMARESRLGISQSERCRRGRLAVFVGRATGGRHGRIKDLEATSAID